VQAYLGRSLDLVVGDRVTLWVDDTGAVELPLRPVARITAIASPQGYRILRTPIIDGSCIRNLPVCQWITVVYDHGWAPDALPPVIDTLIAALAARLVANPDGLRAEQIGGYRADYGSAASAELTDDERRLLRPYRCMRNATTTQVAMRPVVDTWVPWGPAST
jgi:hypothetical protein